MAIQRPTNVSSAASDLYSYDQLEAYFHPQETQAQLPWAELVTLDLADQNIPGGKEKLAKQVEHAAHHVGFFYVKNFGIAQEIVDRQFTLAKHFFKLPLEEKIKYECNFEKADYNGWRGRPRTKQDQNFDNVEVFNIPKFIKDFEGKYDYPDLLKAHLDEIEAFQRSLHANVIIPLLRLFAIVLKLPEEDFLVRQHVYEEKSEDHLRYMIYHPRTEQQLEATNFGRQTGHTDLGTITLLFRQPIAGLQILGNDGKWTYVSAQPDTITVNLADTISHMTGGWLKSSVHRVVSPPEDQREHERTGLLYFVRPSNDTILYPITKSPVLEEAGVTPQFDRPVTAGEWVRAKQELQLNLDLAEDLATKAGDGTFEVVAGFRDKMYEQKLEQR